MPRGEVNLRSDARCPEHAPDLSCGGRSLGGSVTTTRLGARFLPADACQPWPSSGQIAEDGRPQRWRCGDLRAKRGSGPICRRVPSQVHCDLSPLCGFGRDPSRGPHRALWQARRQPRFGESAHEGPLRHRDQDDRHRETPGHRIRARLLLTRGSTVAPGKGATAPPRRAGPWNRAPSQRSHVVHPPKHSPSIHSIVQRFYPIAAANRVEQFHEVAPRTCPRPPAPIGPVTLRSSSLRYPSSGNTSAGCRCLVLRIGDIDVNLLNNAASSRERSHFVVSVYWRCRTQGCIACGRSEYQCDSVALSLVPRVANRRIWKSPDPDLSGLYDWRRRGPANIVVVVAVLWIKIE